MPRHEDVGVIVPERHACAVRVVGVRWERIQLVVRLALPPDADGRPAASDFVLQATAEGRSPLPARPVRDVQAGPDELEIRFNVFVAERQMPLDPGRWQLLLRGTEPGAECNVETAPDAVRLVSGARDFPFGGGLYRVDLRPGAPGRPFTIVTSLWRAASPRRRWGNPLRRARGWWRRLVRQVRVRLFQALVGGLRLAPRRGRLIVFTSDSRTELGGNLKLVHDRMVERGLDRRFRLKTIFKPSVRTRRSLRDRVRLVWLLARADVILLDDYQPAIYRVSPRPDVRIIQLWHAWGAFKTVGYSRMGKPAGPNPYSSVHKNYTYAIVGSEHEVPFYAEAFGLPEDRVVPTGIPRMDQFLDADRQAAGRQRALAAFPAAEGHEVILFAPTFRGGGARNARYAMELIDFAGLHALCEERDAIAILKLHPFVDAVLPIPDEYRDRLFDASRTPVEVNDLLLISDLLVTDYSSLVFEFSTLGRPMLFFAYDLDEYVATRDFYEPFEDFVPGRIVRTFDELLDAMRREDHQLEKVAPFAQRHLPRGRGSSTDRIIDELILPS